MSTASYISIIERYHEHRSAIHELMASILNSLGEEHLLEDKSAQCQAMERLAEAYPFMELMFVLDERGVQISDNITVNSRHPNAYSGRGRDRSQRPYFYLAREANGVIVTEPFLSSTSRKLCIATATRWPNSETILRGYMVLEIDLAAVVEFLMGDAPRRRFQPFFKSVYSAIVVGLFVVVGALLYAASTEIYALLGPHAGSTDTHLKPFSVIIFLTLALAVFDLGKTTLEEEVLMHKDVFRHSSTRRTITRFVAAILIAVSIESLLLMFKSALGEATTLVPAVWMMIAAVGLLIGLGLYVYLGARAEALLISIRRHEPPGDGVAAPSPRADTSVASLRRKANLPSDKAA
jgi:hypothetical protein